MALDQRGSGPRGMAWSHSTPYLLLARAQIADPAGRVLGEAFCASRLAGSVRVGAQAALVGCLGGRARRLDDARDQLRTIVHGFRVRRGVSADTDYRYELRRGDEVVATGHLSSEQPFEAGERITIGSQSGIVRSIEPLLGERELRLIVQLARDDLSAT